MNSSGIGIGSAFLTLIFVTLCLAVFAMISHTSAENEIAMARAEAAFVKGYYEADAFASIIAAELVSAETIPESLFGVDIGHVPNEVPGQGMGTQESRVEFSLEMSQARELYVMIALNGGAYDILSWRIRDTSPWLPDTSLPVRRP